MQQTKSRSARRITETTIPAMAPVERPPPPAEAASTVPVGSEGTPLSVPVGEEPKTLVEVPVVRPVEDIPPASMVVPEPLLMPLVVSTPFSPTAEVARALPALIITGLLVEAEASLESSELLVFEDVAESDADADEPVEGAASSEVPELEGDEVDEGTEFAPVSVELPLLFCGSSPPDEVAVVAWLAAAVVVGVDC